MSFGAFPQRVLLVTGEPIGERLAGPAIRVWHMAEALAAEGHAVTVASTGGVARHSEHFAGADFHGAHAEELVDASDIVVFQGSFYATMPWLAAKPQVQVMDLYDPFHIEYLQSDQGSDVAERERRIRELTVELNAQLGRADLVLCATERQRDLWLGHLGSIGRLRPSRATGHETDGAIDELVRIVPFGLPDEPFRPDAVLPTGSRAIRTPERSIGEDDVVLLWAGGIYDWFDPLTLIRAVEAAHPRAPSLKLFFLSSVHPNSAVAAHSRAHQAVELARELGIEGTLVHFNDRWVPYDERSAYLADADAGVTTHTAGLETRFSFRTRNLDYLWAGLPIVTSDGDSFADLVRDRGVGVVVPPGDVEALADALVALVADAESRSEWAAHSIESASAFRWSETLRPLLAFVADPHRSSIDVASAQPASSEKPGVGHDLRTAIRHLRAGGLALFMTRLANRRRRNALRRGGS